MHIGHLLELLPEVALARAMQLKGKRRGDFSRTIVARPDERIAAGGAR